MKFKTYVAATVLVSVAASVFLYWYWIWAAVVFWVGWGVYGLAYSAFKGKFTGRPWTRLYSFAAIATGVLLAVPASIVTAAVLIRGG